MGNLAGPVETEVKIRMDADAEAARRFIESHGFRVIEERRLQVDQVLDTPDGALRASGRLLRVRSDGAKDSGIVTFKGPVVQGSPHKSREELETTASDRAMLELILARLGFVPSFRYEKYRTEFRASTSNQEDGVIALDETPIGVFIELEGPAYWIDGTALRLGFSPKDFIILSYAGLYRDYLKQNPGPSDMIFLRDVVRSPGKNP